MINEEENAVLLIAGFTQREINTQKRKFHNLFRVEPWLVPTHREGGQLSTAAPDLLAALNAMLTHMGLDEDDWNKATFEQARAAIDKAKRQQK